MRTLTLSEKLEIVKRVGNPSILPETQRELDIYLNMLKRTDVKTYYEIVKRLDVVDTTQHAVTAACKAFFDTLKEHFPDAEGDTVHPQVMLRFESVAKVTALNWVSKNYRIKKV